MTVQEMITKLRLCDKYYWKAYEYAIQGLTAQCDHYSSEATRLKEEIEAEGVTIEMMDDMSFNYIYVPGISHED